MSSRQFDELSDQVDSDPTSFSLSVTQLESFDRWLRPQDALPPPALNVETNFDLSEVVAGFHTDLVQDAATDCSVVASLCAITARAERGHVKVCPTTRPVI